MQPILFLFLLAAALFTRTTQSSSREKQDAAHWKQGVDSDPPKPPPPPDLMNMPQVQVELNNPDFPALDHDAIRLRLYIGFNDMLTMAGFACTTFNQFERAYQRYFGERRGSHPGLVRSIICNIAGYDNPTTCNVLDVTQRPPRVSPRYQKLTIIAGKDNRLTQPDLDDEVVAAATTFQQLRNEGIGDDDDAAITQVYKRGFDYPTLEQIINDRTCRNLGPADSGLMTSLGAHLLHEMIHWRYLLRTQYNEEAYDQIITQELYVSSEDEDEDDEGDLEKVDITIDYEPDRFQDIKPNDPEDGYGPRNAAQLVINNQGDSVRNTDNYRWYIVTKYWQWICRREFAGQNDADQDDTMIPAGSNGQVPYPGEA